MCVCVSVAIQCMYKNFSLLGHALTLTCASVWPFGGFRGAVHNSSVAEGADVMLQASPPTVTVISLGGTESRLLPYRG